MMRVLSWVQARTGRKFDVHHTDDGFYSLSLWEGYGDDQTLRHWFGNGETLEDAADEALRSFATESRPTERVLAITESAELVELELF